MNLRGVYECLFRSKEKEGTGADTATKGQRKKENISWCADRNVDTA